MRGRINCGHEDGLGLPPGLAILSKGRARNAGHCPHANNSSRKPVGVYAVAVSKSRRRSLPSLRMLTSLSLRRAPNSTRSTSPETGEQKTRRGVLRALKSGVPTLTCCAGSTSNSGPDPAEIMTEQPHACTATVLSTFCSGLPLRGTFRPRRKAILMSPRNCKRHNARSRRSDLDLDQGAMASSRRQIRLTARQSGGI